MNEPWRAGEPAENCRHEPAGAVIELPQAMHWVIHERLLAGGLNRRVQDGRYGRPLIMDGIVLTTTERRPSELEPLLTERVRRGRLTCQHCQRDALDPGWRCCPWCATIYVRTTPA